MVRRDYRGAGIGESNRESNVSIGPRSHSIITIIRHCYGLPPLKDHAARKPLVTINRRRRNTRTADRKPADAVRDELRRRTVTQHQIGREGRTPIRPGQIAVCGLHGTG